MSFPSKEKGREDSTSAELDEDSGHDSVDSLHTAADERERIAHLETAVSWIRQEVVSGCVRTAVAGRSRLLILVDYEETPPFCDVHVSLF